MDIKTKFNIGDTVYHMFHDKIRESQIDAIRIRATTKGNPIITYEMNIVNDYGYETIGELNIFATKEELIKSL